ncbi:hypothetical protein, partial [Vibrio cyclitrophicus]
QLFTTISISIKKAHGFKTRRSWLSCSNYLMKLVQRESLDTKKAQLIKKLRLSLSQAEPF